MITQDQIKMLNNVKQAFSKAPYKLSMSNWCGTTQCIAGELVLQNNPKLWGEVFSNSSVKCPAYYIQEEGCNLLGIIKGYDTYKIFFAESWPAKFAKAFNEIFDLASGLFGRIGNQMHEAQVKILENVIDSYIAYRSQDKIYDWNEFVIEIDNVAQ